MFKLNSPAIFLVILFVYALNNVKGEVWVYPQNIETFKSQKYYVRIIQDDNVFDSFVMKSYNQSENANDQLTKSNHWTSFSFNGKITIEVTKLFGDPIRYCIVRPKETRIKPVVDGHVFKIQIENPQQLYIEINEAEEDPLFIFANPPEPNIPYDDDSVLYFGPGYHRLTQPQRVANKNVYIAGGAIVTGTFIFQNVEPVKIYGRGILTGIDVQNRKQDGDLIYASRGNYAPLIIEGITFTDASGFCINADRKLNISNIKCLGWSANSKGIFIGDNSEVSNCFFKVDGDAITINKSNIFIKKSIIWQQINGAPFQFTCDQGCQISNISIQETDIIRMDIYNDSIWTSNKTIFNCLNLNGGRMNNVIVSEMRVEGNVHRFLGFNVSNGGSITDITFKNVEIEGVLAAENFISALNGSVTNILFDNVIANFMKITNEYDAYIERRGRVEEVNFSWRNY